MGLKRRFVQRTTNVWLVLELATLLIGLILYVVL
jgi:hypothetical protein